MSSIYSAQGLAPKSRLTPETYQQLYQQSIEQNEMFWQQQAEQFLDWFKPWDKVKECNLQQGEVSWFINGQLNVSYNCIDRHLKEHGQDTAFIYEADEPGQAQHISYQMLHDKVCQLANLLVERGVKKGDRVCIYLPMIPEAVYSMLACARIGAVHSVVFAGFSPNALKDRILDSGANVLITADEGLRAGKTIPLKHNADIALEQCPDVHTCLVVKRTHADLAKQAIDLDFQQACAKQSTRCEPVPMDAEDPLFILYTSGSTGKPKGVLHTTAGYLLGATISHHYVFDYKPGEVYWCTADVGWITGHSYIVYGPLANRATSILFESTPTYPDASRCWQIIDEHLVTTFYTAPTAIRALMAAGQEYLKPYQLDSLRLLGTVGEPINPEAWQWYFNEVGKGRCPIVDTWWQTETGSIMISPIPGAIDLKPGSATQPFFGIEPVLLDEQGEEINGVGQGNLAFKTCWPSQIRSVYGDHQRLIDTYYSDYPGYYFTGDGAKRDADGNYTITGRVDDVLNVSGHRLGTAEIESAVMQHQAVVEVAAVGFPHEIKGEAIYLFITSNNGELKPDVLGDEITELIVQRIGAIARPDHIQWSKDLPKTRSGKIMRRILRKIAANQIDEIGDTSTLADPSVVQDLIDQRANP